jgi:hypothetical protein
MSKASSIFGKVTVSTINNAYNEKSNKPPETAKILKIITPPLALDLVKITATMAKTMSNEKSILSNFSQYR